MTQQPSTAKRMRSNTSNDFNSAPPALRHSTSNQNIGLYTPTGYNTNFAPAPALRQNTGYSPYQTTAQPNGYGDSFRAAPAPYTESYDPHGQPNSYAAAYAQSVPNGQNTNLTASYTQNAVSNAHTGPYVHLGRQSNSAGSSYSPVSTGPSYSPVPSPVPGNGQSTNYSELQGQTTNSVSRQSISQYGESYSSQPATAYHGHSVSYPEPTVNPQYSPPTLNQTLCDESMPDDDDGEEDAQGEEVDEATEVYTNPTPIIEEEPPKPPDSKCACKKGRGKKKACTSCACSKYGRKCGKVCSCGDACGNPFQDLTAFFGPTDKFPKPCEANPCFATWLSNQPNIEELDMDLMVDMLLYDDKSWATIKGHTKPFKEWEDQWLKAKNAKAKKSRETKARLEFELLRGALGNCNSDGFHRYEYSFCKSQWVPMDDWEHCRECKTCTPSAEWHCETHGRCTTNRSCPGCTGVAASFSDMVRYPEQI